MSLYLIYLPYLVKEQIRLERVQNKLLNYIAFKMNIHHVPHDYCKTGPKYFFASRRVKADLDFLFSVGIK